MKVIIPMRKQWVLTKWQSPRNQIKPGKLNSKRRGIIPGLNDRNLEVDSLPEEEETVEEAVIPEEVPILEEGVAANKDFNSGSLKQSKALYSSTLWITLELNTTPALIIPQRYTTSSLIHKRQCWSTTKRMERYLLAERIAMVATTLMVEMAMMTTIQIKEAFHR